ncbi:1402_t:CDS:1, partial [Paraglomus brasilianum]
NDAQTDSITCDHEEENNRRVMNELKYKILTQHLLDYNKRTFEKFMRDVNREYNERVNANNKMRCEIEDLKMQAQEAGRKAGIYEVKLYS